MCVEIYLLPSLLTTTCNTGQLGGSRYTMEEPILNAEYANLKFEVEGEPGRILTMIRGYFESDEWPYREKSTVLGPDLVSRTKLTCIVDQPYNTLGCFVWLALFVITLGAAIIAWLFWILFERQGVLPQVVGTAYPESPGVCRVTIVSEKKPEYAEPLAAWIQRELVEKKRAVETPQHTSPTPIREGVATQQATSSTSIGDIPEQIRKLGELRDAGFISEAEFESKKRDLLDRM
jgi:hypothetical protein